MYFLLVPRFLQGMLEAIKKETQDPKHADYGMFMLTIMSHGTENDCIYGADLPECIHLQDVYDLVTPLRFQRMAGKPKFIIVQACGGSKCLYIGRYLRETFSLVKYPWILFSDLSVIPVLDWSCMVALFTIN